MGGALSGGSGLDWARILWFPQGYAWGAQDWRFVTWKPGSTTQSRAQMKNKSKKHTLNLTHVILDVCFSMKANPGGQIDLKSVIGRDRLIQSIWEIVQQQSLVMTAERRIGKTTVMKKMAAEPAMGWLPVYQDLENCHSAADFAMAVYKQVHHFLSGKSKFTRRSIEFLKALGGTEIGGVFKLPEQAASHWKDVLTKAIEDLMHENDEGTKLLFLWDEMPFMLMNIRNGEGEQTAMQVLDHLRWLRQTHGGLRMIITGSIGLHHVLTSLKEKSYANSPVNDMATVDVPPLAEKDAAGLASLLIVGETLESPDAAVAATAIAREADCFAFYIHHIARGLKLLEWAANPENVARVVATHLMDANDPWQLIHYRERISTYYPNDQKEVLLILDELAAEKDNASVTDLLAMLKSMSQFDDRERLLRLLTLMERDHYLKRDEAGTYGFRFPLIRRWWKLNRGL